MRSLIGGIAHVASVIERDLADRETGLQKPHVSALADLCASALATRSVNSSEWIAVMPRKECDEKSKERYISRFLSNKLIDPDKVMTGYIPEIMEMCGSSGRTILLMMDQSQISSGFESLMVSLRVNDRAIPVAWRVVETKGPIGFEVQKELLNAVKEMVPEGVSILLCADRFYGTSALVKWCKDHQWGYRIRLKSNLHFEHQGGLLVIGDCLKQGLSAIEQASFHKTQVVTNIGILHEEGHPEPWIIAMDCKPSKYTTLDYGLRWGIEAMFSDFKSRGFGITSTKLIHTDRIQRLILILTISLYWAVSTGMKPKVKGKHFTKKNATVL
jgi:hypothetical protein